MGIKYNNDLGDTNTRVYVAGTQSVGTTEIEAKVGSEPEPERQFIRIFNDGPQTVYFGPSGVTSSTGEPLRKNQHVEIAARDNLGVFLITASGTATVRIQEIG